LPESEPPPVPKKKSKTTSDDSTDNVPRPLPELEPPPVVPKKKSKTKSDDSVPRTFKESWKVGRPWLELKDDGKMYCNYCLDCQNDAAFSLISRPGSLPSVMVLGSDNFKSESIKVTVSV